MHIRRTDHIKTAIRVSKYMDDDIFEKIISDISYVDNDCLVFLSTDDYETQQKYLEKYHQIIIYKKINKPSKELSIFHRQTSLEDALIDVLIASRGLQFYGTTYSSFSELIMEFHDKFRKNI